MQVMPSDGLAAAFECVNGPCFASRPSIEELLEPEFNIQYGTRMLAGLYGRYQDLRLALKAYGPMDVGFAYADKVLAIYERYGQD
jgi:soluble lytic murein transglycosylase-like protein